MSLDSVSSAKSADITLLPRPQTSDRILVVDDDESICRFVKTVLKAAGYEVLCVNSGEAALEICDQDPCIKLIIADVVMPKLGGHQLANHISGLHPEIKVLLMSGYPNLSGLLDGIASRTEKLRSECNLIPKPFSPSDLTRKVREILTQEVDTVSPQPL